MKRFFFVLMIAMIAAVPASAGENGFYLGLGLGMPSFEAEDFVAGYEDLRFEEDTFGFKFFGGYKILRYLAVEAGYDDYGTVTKHERSVTNVEEEFEVSIGAWNASVVGILPLGKKVDLYAKVGVASWNADVRVTIDDEADDQSRSDVDVTYGIGIDFILKILSIRVAADWLEISDTSGTFMFSGSLTYHF